MQIDFKPIRTFNSRVIGAGALQREGPVGLQSLGAPSLRPAAAAAASPSFRQTAALQREGPLGPRPVETIAIGAPLARGIRDFKTASSMRMFSVSTAAIAAYCILLRLIVLYCGALHSVMAARLWV